jgi:hypothetical protein
VLLGWFCASIVFLALLVERMRVSILDQYLDEKYAELDHQVDFVVFFEPTLCLYDMNEFIFINLMSGYITQRASKERQIAVRERRIQMNLQAVA